ncbi:MAG: hypothetical protein ACKO43_07450, partial [Alphaproteobacteria bacterium]
MAEHARLEAVPKALDQHQKARIIEQMRALLDVMMTTDRLKKIDEVEAKLIFLSTHLMDRYLDPSLHALMRHIPTETKRLAAKARSIVLKNNEIFDQKQKIDAQIEALRPLMEQTQATLWSTLQGRPQRDGNMFIQYKRMETLMGTFDKMALSLGQIAVLQMPQAVDNEQNHYRAMVNLVLYLKPKLPNLRYQKELDDLIHHFSRSVYLFDLKQENISLSSQLVGEHLALNQNLFSLQNQLTQTGVGLAKRVTDALEYQAREGFLASMIVFVTLGTLFFFIALILLYGIVKPMTRASHVLRNLHHCDPHNDLMHSDVVEMESI